MTAQSTQNTSSQQPGRRVYTTVYTGTVVDQRTIRYEQAGEAALINFAKVDVKSGTIRKGVTVTFKKAQIHTQGAPVKAGDKAEKTMSMRAVEIEVQEQPVTDNVAVIAQPKPTQAKAQNKDSNTQAKTQQPAERSDRDIALGILGMDAKRAQLQETLSEGVVMELCPRSNDRGRSWIEYKILGPANETYFADRVDLFDVHPVTGEQLDLDVGDKVTFYIGVNPRRVWQGHAYAVRLADQSIIQAMRPKTKQELVGERLNGRLGFVEKPTKRILIQYWEGPTQLEFEPAGMEYFHPLMLIDGEVPHGATVNFLVDNNHKAVAIRPQTLIQSVELTNEGVRVTYLRFFWTYEPMEVIVIFTGHCETSAALREFDGNWNSQDRKKNTKKRELMQRMLDKDWPELRLKLAQAEQKRQREQLIASRRQELADAINLSFPILTFEDDIVADGDEVVYRVNLGAEDYDLRATLEAIELADNTRYELI